MTPLYNHNSRETAYQVDSYPYGRLRCKIWFWLEYTEKKGFRFCSQTENPKNGRMNAHKKSTYSKFAACMYLDDNGHVQWDSINEYTDCNKSLTFAQQFPNADLSVLKMWAHAKACYCLATLKAGQSFGRPLTENDISRYNHECEVWKQVKLTCETEKNKD